MLLLKSTASRCRYTLSSASRRNIAASQCFKKRRQQRRITVRALKLERDAVGHLRPQARRRSSQRRRCRGGHPVWHLLDLGICTSAAIAQGSVALAKVDRPI